MPVIMGYRNDIALIRTVKKQAADNTYLLIDDTYDLFLVVFSLRCAIFTWRQES